MLHEQTPRFLTGASLHLKQMILIGQLHPFCCSLFPTDFYVQCAMMVSGQTILESRHYQMKTFREVTIVESAEITVNTERNYAQNY